MHQVLQRDEDELEELEGTVEGFKMVLRRMDKLVEIVLTRKKSNLGV